MRTSRKTSAPTRQQRRTDRTRARLLDAALAVMLAHGYESAPLGEVTERADLGTGTLYLHFRDKRSLYEAVVRRELLGLRERWQLAERRPSDAADEVVFMLRLAIEWFAEHPQRTRLFLCEGPPVETWLVDEIGRGIALVLAGRVAAPELVAHLAIGAGLAAGRWLVTRPREMDSEALISATAEFCAGGIAAGSAPPVVKRTRTRRS